MKGWKSCALMIILVNSKIYSKLYCYYFIGKKLQHSPKIEFMAEFWKPILEALKISLIPWNHPLKERKLIVCFYVVLLYTEFKNGVHLLMKIAKGTNSNIFSESTTCDAGKGISYAFHV